LYHLNLSFASFESPSVASCGDQQLERQATLAHGAGLARVSRVRQVGLDRELTFISNVLQDRWNRLSNIEIGMAKIPFLIFSATVGLLRSV
jgi:hypothetical protein